MRGLTTHKAGKEDLGNVQDAEENGENLEEDGIKSKYNIYEKKSQKKAQKIKKKTPKNAHKKAQKTETKNASPPQSPRWGTARRRNTKR